MGRGVVMIDRAGMPHLDEDVLPEGYYYARIQVTALSSAFAAMSVAGTGMGGLWLKPSMRWGAQGGKPNVADEPRGKVHPHSP